MVMGDMEMHVDLAVIGAGPGGMAAAFRAADLGLDVALIDPHDTPGGNYLYQNCIPARLLYNIVSVIAGAKKLSKYGVIFGPPEIDPVHINGRKEEIVVEIGTHLAGLAKHKGIQFIQGVCRFEAANRLQIDGGDISRLSFRSCVIGAGSKPAPVGNAGTSTGKYTRNRTNAFSNLQTKSAVLIIGDSSAALETAAVYHSLGCNVSLATQKESLLPHIDEDLSLPLQKRSEEMLDNLYLQTQVTGLSESDDGVEVVMAVGNRQFQHHFDLLISADSVPACPDLSLENAGVLIGRENKILVDEQLRTNVENIFAVGGAAGYHAAPHISMRQGLVASEVIAGRPSAFDVLAVPHVLFTDPQISWCGLSELEANRRQIPVITHTYDWKDSYSTNTVLMCDGLTKLIADPDSGRLLGIAICGKNAELLISQGALAIEMGCLVEDLALTLHPHPALSESLAHCAENILGTSLFTQLLPGQNSHPVRRTTR